MNRTTPDTRTSEKARRGAELANVLGMKPTADRPDLYWWLESAGYWWSEKDSAWLFAPERVIAS